MAAVVGVRPPVLACDAERASLIASLKWKLMGVGVVCNTSPGFGPPA